MNKFEYINKNLEHIRICINFGISYTSVLSHFEAYKNYINFLNKGFKKAEATKLAAEELKVSMHFIQRIRKEMETEVESETEIVEEIKLLRKQLVKKGYSLVGNSKTGYAIKDKYSKVAKKVTSLGVVDRFLSEYWKIHFDKIFKKKIPPVNN
jgi:hypothetical protein